MSDLKLYESPLNFDLQYFAVQSFLGSMAVIFLWLSCIFIPHKLATEINLVALLTLNLTHPLFVLHLVYRRIFQSGQVVFTGFSSFCYLSLAKHFIIISAPIYGLNLLANHQLLPANILSWWQYYDCIFFYSINSLVYFSFAKALAVSTED